MEERTQTWLVYGGIVVAVAALFAFIFLTVEQPPAPKEVDIASVQTADNPVAGSTDAPVTIAYWSDYQCPACKQFEENVLGPVMTDYVDTGNVKVVYKDFAFLGEHSTVAALAARAVWEIDPGKFTAWHKAMFEKQDGENSGWGGKADVLALVASLGIDEKKVGELMENKAHDYQKLLDADRAEGVAFGAQGTPSVIIGKQLLFGASPYAKIRDLIEAQLPE